LLFPTTHLVPPKIKVKAVKKETGAFCLSLSQAIHTYIQPFPFPPQRKNVNSALLFPRSPTINSSGTGLYGMSSLISDSFSLVFIPRVFAAVTKSWLETAHPAARHQGSSLNLDGKGHHQFLSPNHPQFPPAIEIPAHTQLISRGRLQYLAF